jgi:exopolyphosphatase/pppGpp-phosphohydrolase
MRRTVEVVAAFCRRAEELGVYDPARVHGHRLTRVVLAGLCARLAALSLAERASLPCLEPGRADLDRPGLGDLPRGSQQARLGCPRGQRPGSLREGILYEILSQG